LLGVDAAHALGTLFQHQVGHQRDAQRQQKVDCPVADQGCQQVTAGHLVLQQGQEDHLQYAQPCGDMGDDPGNAADQQHTQHPRVEGLGRQQQPDQQGHQRPVECADPRLHQRQFPGGQFNDLVADRPAASGGKGAGQYVGHGGSNHRQADQAQPAIAHRPALRQRYPTRCKHGAGQPQIAQPVGNDAQAEDPGDGGHVQPQAGVQPKAQGYPANQGIEIEVEGVADEYQGNDLANGQPVAGVVAPQQVVAGVGQVAEQRHANGSCYHP